MISFIYGGSSSGKSAFAENRIMELSDNRYYLATMQVYGSEGRTRVEKHRRLRADKGFTTLEYPVDIEGCLTEIADSESAGADIAILLECMSNLVANEMFTEKGTVSGLDVVSKIDTSVRKIADTVNDLVIVSNNVFDDGIEYDNQTVEYLKALGEINVILAKMADEVYEVVAGIPVRVK